MMGNLKTYCELLQFIEIIYINNTCNQYVILSFLHTFCKAFYSYHSNSCISTLIENWTHVYMNLFTRNSPYYHLLKYLLFLLKHPVCITYCCEQHMWPNFTKSYHHRRMVGDATYPNTSQYYVTCTFFVLLYKFARSPYWHNCKNGYKRYTRYEYDGRMSS